MLDPILRACFFFSDITPLLVCTAFSSVDYTALTQVLLEQIYCRTSSLASWKCECLNLSQEAVKTVEIWTPSKYVKRPLHQKLWFQKHISLEIALSCSEVRICLVCEEFDISHRAQTIVKQVSRNVTTLDHPSLLIFTQSNRNIILGEDSQFDRVQKLFFHVLPWTTVIGWQYYSW